MMPAHTNTPLDGKYLCVMFLGSKRVPRSLHITTQTKPGLITEHHIGPLSQTPMLMFQTPVQTSAFIRRLKFVQISEFERGRIVGLREAGLSYRAVAARVQRNSSTIMRVSKQWTDEGRTAEKSASGPQNVTSAREDRRLVRMAQTNRTASSRQLAAQWSTTTRVALCASSIWRRLLQRGLRARIPLCRIPHAKPSAPAATLGQCA
ncbi:transposable element Tc1 transposase [Trichonephila clavipes]|nr:transposable element Tc1 transposase [Trichonephila clavipes]